MFGVALKSYIIDVYLVYCNIYIRPFGNERADSYKYTVALQLQNRNSFVGLLVRFFPTKIKYFVYIYIYIFITSKRHPLSLVNPTNYSDASFVWLV